MNKSIILSFKLLFVCFTISSCTSHIMGLKTVKAHHIKEQDVPYYIPVNNIKAIEPPAIRCIDTKKSFDYTGLKESGNYKPLHIAINIVTQSKPRLKLKSKKIIPTSVQITQKRKERGLIYNASAHLILSSILLYVNSFLLIVPFNSPATMVLVVGMVLLFSLFLIVRGFALQTIQSPNGLNDHQKTMRSIVFISLISFITSFLLYSLILYAFSTSNAFNNIFGGLM